MGGAAGEKCICAWMSNGIGGEGVNVMPTKVWCFPPPSVAHRIGLAHGLADPVDHF